MSGKLDVEAGLLAGRRGYLPALALVISILLAQAAFLGVRFLSGHPSPHPDVQVGVFGEGTYWHPDTQRHYGLVYTDRVTAVLAVRPVVPVSISHRRWEGDRLVETDPPPFGVVPPATGVYTWQAGPLAPGPSAVVVRAEPAHHGVANVWTLPRPDPYAMPSITRTATFTVTPDSIDVIYRAEYGPGAPVGELHGLIAGEIPPGLFLKRVFYATRDAFTARDLTSIDPYPFITSQGRVSVVEIRARSTQPFYNPERLPILVNLSPAEGHAATIVRVASSGGASLRFSTPPPSYASGDTWSWAITPHMPDLHLNVDFGGRLDPIRSPVAWGRHHLVQLMRRLWGWQVLGRYARVSRWVIVLLPWLTPWLYGIAAALPLALAWTLTDMAGARRVAAVGLGLALGVALAATTANVVGLVVERVSVPGLFWAGTLAVLGVLLLFYHRPSSGWRWLIPAGGSMLVGGLLAWSSWPGLASGPATARLSMDVVLRPAGWAGGWMVVLFGVPFLAFVLWLSVCAWLRGGEARPCRIPGWALGLITLLLILLVIPTARRVVDHSPVVQVWTLNPGRELALLASWVGLPYVALFLLLALLRHSGQGVTGEQGVEEASSLAEAVAWLQAEEERAGATWKQREIDRANRARRGLALGMVLFVVLAVGWMRRPLTTFAALVPVAPLLAWAGLRLLARRPQPDDLPYGLRALLAVPTWRREIVDAALGLSARDGTGEGKESEGGGDESGSTAAADLLQPFTERPDRRISLVELAFGWGGGQGPWERGLVAARRALALVVPLVIIFGPSLFDQIAARAATAFGLLEAVFVFIGPFVLRWLLYAFVLGYLFPYLRGNNGWEKGLFLGVVIGVANMTQDTLLYAQSMADVKGLLLEAGATVLMTCVVGVWTFDYRRLAEAGGRLSDLRALYALSTVAGYLFSVLPPTATIVVEASQGQLDGLLRAFVEMVLPRITGL